MCRRASSTEPAHGALRASRAGPSAAAPAASAAQRATSKRELVFFTRRAMYPRARARARARIREFEHALGHGLYDVHMPLASPALAPARVVVERRPDGTLVLASPIPLGDPPRHVVDLLRRWAEAAPDRTFLAERPAAGAPFRKIAYGEARRLVDRLAQALLDHGLSAERPLLILSENGVDHALLTLAAMQAGVPAAPVSPAYSLLSA